MLASLNVDTLPAIIVAESDRDLCSDISWSLSQAGFRVLSANDGRAALDLLNRGTVAALVADVDMPGISGIDLLQTLRNVGQYLPVLLIADGTTLSLARAHLVGSQGVLEKPIDPAALLAMIHNVVRARRSGTRHIDRYRTIG